eukprot:3221978-Karenia_brevis.AAC.1
MSMTIDDTKLTFVNEMQVVGCMLASDATTGAELESKANKAMAAFRANSEQLCCKYAEIGKRLTLLYKLVGQVLLYGLETVALTQTFLDRLDGHYA